METIAEQVNRLLPGTHPGSDIRSILADLLRGKTLTSLDAVRGNHTVCLTKYISNLRLKYNLTIMDQRIKVTDRKWVKQYWIDRRTIPEVTDEDGRLD